MVRFLPTSLKDGKRFYKDFERFDVIFVTGDPYYDHPLSGVAILSRLLDRKGYRIGIIAQPESEEDFSECGKPKYFFCISSGLLDSMLANYTPMLKKREKVLVPERAVISYTQHLKRIFPDSLTVIGGVEATLRRFTHFDYKENKLRRGILNDSKADILIFGDAERPILNLLEIFKKEKTLEKARSLFRNAEGLSYRIRKEDIPKDAKMLPSFEECIKDRKNFNKLTSLTYMFPDDAFVEQTGLGYIIHNKRSYTLTEEEMDFIYASRFTRKIHPDSKNLAFNRGMVSRLETSVVIGRGCFGGCNFCIIPLVQGKQIARRSIKGIVGEIEFLSSEGYNYIADLTLPTLNMYGSSCALFDRKIRIYSPILDKDIDILVKELGCNQQCVGCKHRVLNEDLGELLVQIEELKKKHPKLDLELRSALRHDMILEKPKLFRKAMKHISRLKIAPENTDDYVLRMMNKSDSKTFVRFLKEFEQINKEQKTNKKLVPYFVVAHPGSTIEGTEKMKKFLEENKIFINLTQVFTPTPGTMSTAMYYSGEHPMTREKVYVPNSFREKKDQKNILFSDEDFDDDNG